MAGRRGPSPGRCASRRSTPQAFLHCRSGTVFPTANQRSDDDLGAGRFRDTIGFSPNAPWYRGGPLQTLARRAWFYWAAPPSTNGETRDENPRRYYLRRRHESDDAVVCTGNHYPSCLTGKSGKANFVGRRGPGKPGRGLRAWLHDDFAGMPRSHLELQEVRSQEDQTARPKMSRGADLSHSRFPNCGGHDLRHRFRCLCHPL